MRYIALLVMAFVLSSCSSTPVFQSVRPVYVSILHYKQYETDDLLVEQQRLIEYAVRIVFEVEDRKKAKALGTMLSVVGAIITFQGFDHDSTAGAVAGSVLMGTGMGAMDVSIMSENQLRSELASIKGVLEAISAELSARGIEEEYLYSEEKIIGHIETLVRP